MMRRTLLATAALGLGLSLGGTASAQALDKAKACFIYVGPKNDGGWSQYHHEAVLKMEEHFAGKVEVQYQESVPEGADAERAMTQMALSGCNIIFGTSFGFMDAVNNVAGKFPNVKFEHATGYKREHANVSTYNARFYEGRAVTATIGGLMTKTNKLGYIGSYPIPEVIQGINAVYVNAKKVNPEVELSVVWAFSWFDPAKEADATKALIDQGVDVIFSHTDSTAPLIEMQKAGNVTGFGQASDMPEFGPYPRVSSIIDDWAPYYIERVGAVLEGKWEQSDRWDGIASGEVKIGEFSSAVPDDVKAKAKEVQDGIVAGTLHPFTGPLNKQDGTVWLKDGETADDATLAGMMFYVEGIKGDIPQ